jgi:hypothetical protein
MKPRERRTRRIRRYVVTATVTMFLAVWSVVYAEMRAGDDPVLGSGTAVATATQPSTQSTTSSDDDGYDDAASVDSSSSSSVPSAVTTQQS